MVCKNKSMYAILGILNISPSTGYDIKKYSDNVLSSFWNENFGHIYPTLKKLANEKMIEVILDNDKQNNIAKYRIKKNEKIKYAITQKGKIELNKWLLEKTVPQPIRSEFMLKLLFSSDQPRENIILMLQDYKTLYEKNTAKYSKILQDLEAGNVKTSSDRIMFLKILLRRGIISDDAIIKWCDETIVNIKSKNN